MNLNFKRVRRKIKYRMLYYIVIGAISLSEHAPRKWWLTFCGFMGRVVSLFTPSLNKRIAHHLTLAYSTKTPREIKILTKKIFTMLGKNAGLVLRNYSKTSSNFYSHCITRGGEHAEKAYLSGRGVIFLTAHIGPFECIAQELALRGYHPFVIGTSLKNSTLNKLLTDNRIKFGGVAIERGKETFRIVKNLSVGGTMAMLIDQDTRVKSVFVDFFGRPCSTPVGATVLAMKTGAAIIPVFAHLNENGDEEIEYYPEVVMNRTLDEETDVVKNTQTLTTIIENQIRKFPDQWVWMHERWKTSRQVALP